MIIERSYKSTLTILFAFDILLSQLASPRHKLHVLSTQTQILVPTYQVLVNWYILLLMTLTTIHILAEASVDNDKPVQVTVFVAGSYTHQLVDDIYCTFGGNISTTLISFLAKPDKLYLML